jgi:hypothetical protein
MITISVEHLIILVLIVFIVGLFAGMSSSRPSY